MTGANDDETFRELAEWRVNDIEELKTAITEIEASATRLGAQKITVRQCIRLVHSKGSYFLKFVRL